jgi:Sec-independent protein secretion pathway component TatC
VAVCACSAAVGFVLLEASFAAQSFPAFAVLFLFGEIFAFVVQAPINAVILWSVPPGGAVQVECSCDHHSLEAHGCNP